jgi:hypothetical protein
MYTSESPRGMWLGEWLRPHSIERSIGVLTVRDNKVSFSEEIGKPDWELELSRVNRVVTINAGCSLLIEAATGTEFIVSIMEADLTPGLAQHASSVIERAMQRQLAPR